MKRLHSLRLAVLGTMVYSLGLHPAAAQTTPAQETWDYLVFSDAALLNKAIPDPTDGCKAGATLQVLGRLGWELVQFVDGYLPDHTVVQGGIALGKPDSSGNQKGTISLQAKSNGKVMAVFKRRIQHAMSGKQCPEKP